MREMAGSKPEFRRQESWRYKRVKENWRRPRGEKKRRGILAKAKDLNFHIANPGKEEGRAVTETPPMDEEKALPPETGEEKMEERSEIAADEDLDKTEESSE